MVRLASIFFLILLSPQVVVALPAPEDVPEEVLRTQIITEGRSPIDGTAVTATEYATIEQALTEHRLPPNINAEIQHTIFLLRVLKLFKTVNPL
jgi:hypothetical protein